MAIQQNIVGDSRIDISEISRGIGDPASPRTGDLLFRIQELIDRVARETTLGTRLAQASWDRARILDVPAVGRDSLGISLERDTVGLGREATLAALRDMFINVQASLMSAPLTAAQTITLDLMGRTVLSFDAWSSVATTFTLERSHDNVTWRTHRTFSAVTSATDGFIVGIRFWRLRSAVAGVAGDTVNLVLQAGR